MNDDIKIDASGHAQPPTRVQLAPLPVCAPDAPYCAVCSDEAQIAQVIDMDAAMGLARVALGEEITEVDVSLIDDIAPGRRLLIHGGVAIGALEE
jgi:hypothetical protein